MRVAWHALLVHLHRQRLTAWSELRLSACDASAWPSPMHQHLFCRTRGSFAEEQEISNGVPVRALLTPHPLCRPPLLPVQPADDLKSPVHRKRVYD